MPFESKKQKRFFQLCLEAPSKVENPEQCPDEATIREYLEEHERQRESRKEGQEENE